MINITRTRYIIARDDGHIFCGLSRAFQFKDPANLRETAIKTYRTETQAKSAFLRSWYADEEDFESGRYRIIKVQESVIEV